MLQWLRRDNGLAPIALEYDPDLQYEQALNPVKGQKIYFVV